MTRPTGSRPSGRAHSRALASLATVAWFPLAVVLLPGIGGLIGLTGEGSPPGLVRWAILIAYFFTPFVVGTILAWTAIRSHPGGGWTVAGWIGLLGNALILVVSISFLAGEVLNPH